MSSAAAALGAGVPSRQATVGMGDPTRRRVGNMRSKFQRGATRQRLDKMLGEVGGAIAGRGIAGAPMREDDSFYPGGGQARKGAESFKTRNTKMKSAISARRQTRPWYILDPRTSARLPVWDCVTMTALLFTALVTPYEVSLLDSPSTLSDALTEPLFVLNRLIDCIFLLDMILQPFVMTMVFNDRDGVKWVDEPTALAQIYLRSWFTLDFLSIAPSTFDIVPLALNFAGDSRWRSCGPATRCLVVTEDAEGSEGSFYSKVKVLRVVRIFRLAKLFRLVRASRMIKRWETRLNVKYAYLLLGWCVIIYLFFSHWAACALLLVTQFEDDPMSTWLGYFGYCVAEPVEVTAMAESPSLLDTAQSLAGDGSCLFPRERSDVRLTSVLHDTCSIRCSTPGDLYITALYMSSQIVVGVSGGDYRADAYNNMEHIAFGIIVGLGALMWGYVVGVFVIVLSNLNPDVQWYRSTLDQLNHFMAISQLPHEMRYRLREFFQQSKHIHRGEQRKQLLRLMSPSLQGEVSMQLNKSWIWTVPFLNDAENDFTVLVSSHMLPAVFAPGEMVAPGYLYLIQKGVALYGGCVKTGGSTFGQDMILGRQNLVRYTGRAITYLEVFRISRDQLLELAQPFPRALAHIRFQAVRLALARTLGALRNAVETAKDEMSKASHAKGVTTEEALKRIGWNQFIDDACRVPLWIHYIATDENQRASVAAAEESDELKRRLAVSTKATAKRTTEDLAAQLDRVQADVARCMAGISELCVQLASSPGPPTAHTPAKVSPPPDEGIRWPFLHRPVDNGGTALSPVRASSPVRTFSPAESQAQELQPLVNKLAAEQKELRKQLRLARDEIREHRQSSAEMHNDIRTMKTFVVSDVLAKLQA